MNLAKKDAHHRAVLNGCLQHTSIWRGNHKQRHPWVPFAMWTVVDISTPVLHAMHLSLDSSSPVFHRVDAEAVFQHSKRGVIISM